MKTKLLRKVRKRFDINYYPNGLYFHSEKYYNDECVLLLRIHWWGCSILHISNQLTISEYAEFNKKIGYEKCYNKLLENILYKYKKYGIRRNKKLEKTEERLWYK